MKALSVFFSDTFWTIFKRFHMRPSVVKMLTIWSNGSAPLNKIATMPKLVKRFFSSTKKALRLNLVISIIWDSKSTKFVQMMILGWPLAILRYGQSFVLVAVAILEEAAWHLQICNSCFLSGERIVAHELLVKIGFKSIVHGHCIKYVRFKEMTHD